MKTADYIKKIVAPQIQSMNAYAVAPSDKLLKLDSMENSYQLSGDWSQALQGALSNAEINRYPDSRAQCLRQRFLEDFSASVATDEIPTDDIDVLFGNGSDELIQLLMQLIANDAGPIMSPSPSFSMYQVFAKIIDKPFQEIALNNDFSIDIDLAEKDIIKHQPALIFISYPNNPTGNLFDKEHVKRIIQCAPGLVVIDEAYSPFSSESFDRDFLEYPNAVLLKTLSKIGFAGIRFGYLFGHKDWINQLNKIRPPYNVNVLSQAVVSAYLDNKAAFEKTAEKIRCSRHWLYQELSQMDGVNPLPSETNFISFTVSHQSANDVFNQLKDNGILIKNLHQPNTPLAEYLRVTIGTQQECEQFLTALKSII